MCIDPEVHGKINKGKQKRALELAQIVVTKTTVLLEEKHHVYVAKNVVGGDNEIGSVSDRIFLTNYQMAKSNKDTISMTYELQDGNNEQSSLGGRIVLDGSQDIGMTQFQTACDLTFDIMIETEHCSVILERGNDPIGSPINADKICGAHPDEGIMDDLSYIGDEIATQFSKAIESIDFSADAQSTSTTTQTTTETTEQDGDTQVIQIDDATPATTPAPDTTSDATQETTPETTPVEPAKTQATPIAIHKTQNAVLEGKPKNIDPKKPKTIHDIRKFENKVLAFTLDTTYSGKCCKIITPESDKIIIDKNFDETDNIAVVATSSAVLAVSDELLDSLGIKNVAFTLSREIPQSDLPRRKLEKTPIMFPPGIPIKMQEGIYHACISFTKKPPMKSIFNVTTNTTEYIEINDDSNNKMANHTCSAVTYINLGGSHYVLSEVENYEKRAIKEEKMHLHMKDDKFSQIIDPNNMTNVIEFLKSNDLSQSTNGLDSLVQIMWETITKEIIDNYHEITTTDQKIAVASNNVNEKRYILDKLNKELLKEKDELYQADGVIAEDKAMKQDSDLDLTKANIKHENSEELQKELAKIWHDLIAAERHEEHQRIGLHEQLEITKNTLDELQAKMKAVCLYIYLYIYIYIFVPILYVH